MSWVPIFLLVLASCSPWSLLVASSKPRVCKCSSCSQRLIKVYSEPTREPVQKQLSFEKLITSLVSRNENCNTPETVLVLKQSVLRAHLRSQYRSNCLSRS
jgi:hypothetical protein